ncbi:acyltransferase family protein [Sphingomonas sp. ID0503]|uniref:acyltransferase family protein n=1 Tax=Sphingomonas sp. ID0503 TaxID=3399691 RepID=UPI003AFAFB68
MKTEPPTAAMPQGQAGRFVFLDGLRGVAAMMVVIYHYTFAGPAENAMQHGYLAVDFFFLLSGFVIAAAYEDRLRTRADYCARFLVARAIRLYPLVILTTLVGFAAVDGPKDMASLLSNMLLLPELTRLGREDSFVLNVAMWSLAMEVLVNILYAVTVRRWLSDRVLIGIVAVSLVGVLYVAATSNDLNIGARAGTLPATLMRTLFSFALGILIYRWRGWLMPARPASPALVLLTFAALLAAPYHAPVNGLFDALAVTVFFPLVLIAGASVVLNFTQAEGCRILGELSYPLYAIQFPFSAALALLLAPLGLTDGAFRLLALLAVLPTAWAVLVLYDRPARAALGARLAGARPRVQAA